MLKQLMSSTGLLLALALFLAVNLLSNAGFRSARLDLTDNNLYTLSEGTRNILGSLQEPITLRLYLSQKLLPDLPAISNYAVRVRETLEEYQRAAGGKLQLHLIDPEPFSEQEDQAVGYGLQGVPVDTDNTTFYFGLAGTNSTDSEEVIGFFQPNREEFLEYDLTKLVYQLANPKQKVVGVMSTLPIEGGGGGDMAALLGKASHQPWMVMEQLRPLFELRTLATEVDAIPAEVDVLMLVHPRELSDATLYAIDQFVLRGGRVLAFVDPYAEAYEPPADPQNPLAGIQAPRNSELDRLLNAWGVELTPAQVAADLQAAKKVQARKDQRTVVMDYPVWMDLKQAHFNADDIVTGKLDGITLATAGILSQRAGAETQFVPLVQTGDQAMAVGTEGLGLFADPEAIVNQFKPAGRYTVAARVTGHLKSAFPEGKPGGEADGAETPAEHLTESKQPVNLIIIADSDLLADQFWVQVQNFFGQRIAIPFAANATLVSNALDSLSGSNDLISVRNRGNSSRPFTRVEEIRKHAEQRYREKEQALQARLTETEQKLRELQSQRQDQGAVLSQAQQQEILKFRDEQLKVRKELRNVQHELRKDIERLEGWMKFINIGLVPLLIGLGGIFLGVYRSRRRRGLSPA